MDREERLIQKAKKGNTEAYGELVQIHKDYLYRNAFCYVKNVDLAYDVFQEAVTVGMLSIKELKNPKYFRTWMTRIIYNCANEIYRREAKERRMQEKEVKNLLEEKTALEQEEILDLHQAVERLEEPYRTVIEQKYFQDMKISEISQKTGRTEGTVKSDLSRAKKKLRMILKEE